MKRIVSIILTCMLTLAFSLNMFAADFAKMITTQKTEAHEKASAKSEKLVTLKEGYKFTPVSETTNYWKIEYKKDGQAYVGYVLKKHTEEQVVTGSKEASAAGKKAAAETQKAKKLRLSGTHKNEKMNVVTKLADMDDFVVFWGNTGDKIHISPECKTFKNGVLFGSLSNGKEAGHTKGWCGVCSKGWTDAKLAKDGNPNVTKAK